MEAARACSARAGAGDRENTQKKTDKHSHAKESERGGIGDTQHSATQRDTGTQRDSEEMT